MSQSGRQVTPLATSVIVLLSLGMLLALGACGEAGKRDGRWSYVRRVARIDPTADMAPALPIHLNDDGDRDGARAPSGAENSAGADGDDDSYGDTYYDFDDQGVLRYGHAASATDARAVTAAVRRYYAVASRGDGSAACQMASSSLQRTVPEAYGEDPNLPMLRGQTCRAVMPRLLSRLRQQLRADSATLKIGVVRVDGATAYALLSFEAAWPNSFAVLRHERGVWKINELMAAGLP